jgi:hypothetical protein
MSDTYARVMRANDGPGNRRTSRARAARRAGTTADPAVTAPEVVDPAADAPADPAAGPAVASIAEIAGNAAGRERKRAAALEQAAGSSPADEMFAAAVAVFRAGRDAQVRRDLKFEDVAAPKRLAPYATAIAATVQRDDTDVAWGRLVLLYDPEGQQGWHGAFRLVAYIRAEVEPEIAADPLLGEVGWSWLSEALDAQVPGYAAPSGTVTRVITEGFGAKRDEVPLTGFELRASWSPAAPEAAGAAPGQAMDELEELGLSTHIAAWCDCLAAAAGLEPPGTRALRPPGPG